MQVVAGQGESGQGESGQGESGQGESGQGESGQGESGQGESGQGESGQGESGQGESGQGESGQGESGQGESGQGESGQGESGQGESGQGESGQGESGQGESGQGESGQGESGQGESGQGESGQGESGQGGERQQRSSNRRAVPSFSHSRLFPQGNTPKGAAGQRSGRSGGGWWWWLVKEKGQQGGNLNSLPSSPSGGEGQEGQQGGNLNPVSSSPPPPPFHREIRRRGWQGGGVGGEGESGGGGGGGRGSRRGAGGAGSCVRAADGGGLSGLFRGAQASSEGLRPLQRGSGEGKGESKRGAGGARGRAAGEAAVGRMQEVWDPVGWLRMGEGFQASSEGLRLSLRSSGEGLAGGLHERRVKELVGWSWQQGECRRGGGNERGGRDAGGVQEVRDPVFGLRMGEGFQASFEGLSYSFRQVINTINPGTFALTSSAAAAAGGGGSAEAGGLGSEEAIGVRCVAPDWLGFGGSDKPQADQKRFGYSPSDYARELGNLVATMGVEDVSVVAQGYFCLPAAEFVLSNPARIRHLIFINPPITDKHAKLPSCLSAFSNFLLGEIFAQDPLRASDRVLEEAGCYLIDEEDAMVYRRPYLASGASGFALTSITRAFQKDLKASLPLVSKALAAVSAQPSSSSTVIWGMKDRWQSFDGVRETCRASGAILVTLDEVGHHAQEDYGEEVGRVIRNILRRTT
ncbi:unnamed protein product [Closterium sp. NIES-64]|nr:unnamed protein product [Closterium sp. NIES-64]